MDSSTSSYLIVPLNIPLNDKCLLLVDSFQLRMEEKTSTLNSSLVVLEEERDRLRQGFQQLNEEHVRDSSNS